MSHNTVPFSAILCAGFLISIRSVDSGEPLFLTRYLDSGCVAEAEIEARVVPPLAGIKSYSGFLTVNKSCNSNLFFWYFPAAREPETAPVLIWSNGWNTTSMYGLFGQHGPYIVNDNAFHYRKRFYSWHKICHIVYLDAMLGEGFSFTESEEGYSRDQETIGENMFSAVIQFFDIFPELRLHDIYIGGASYSGKFTTALAYTIHSSNAKSHKLNMKGILYANPVIDPISQFHYGTFLRNIGLVDAKQEAYFDAEEKKTDEQIERRQYLNASVTISNLIYNFGHSYFYNITGIMNPYNYVDDRELPTGWVKFVQNPYIRKVIHVGDRPMNDGIRASFHLFPDFTTTVKPWVEVLVENYRLLFYNGQFDVVQAYPMMAKMLDSLRWTGSDQFKNSSRRIWRSGAKVNGYIRSHGNLMEVMVTGAGHMAATDQPRKVMSLIESFLWNKSIK